jgi:hypothetical protein|tara:strand:- start:335 stop:643 length:309 start_codon:yes stop_codon:yes gene_type:complete
MNKNYFFLIILIFLSSCQDVKNALTGKKYEDSDEFLVIKKNPLVLPPNFNDLPTPKDVADTTQIENIENEIEDLISSIKDSDEVSESSSNDTESFVLEKIKD